MHRPHVAAFGCLEVWLSKRDRDAAVFCSEYRIADLILDPIFGVYEEEEQKDRTGSRSFTFADLFLQRIVFEALAARAVRCCVCGRTCWNHDAEHETIRENRVEFVTKG